MEPTKNYNVEVKITHDLGLGVYILLAMAIIGIVEVITK